MHVQESATRMIGRYGRRAWQVARDTAKCHDVDTPGFEFWRAVADLIEARRAT